MKGGKPKGVLETKLQITLVILGIIAALLNIIKTLLEIVEKIMNMTNSKSPPNPPTRKRKRKR